MKALIKAQKTAERTEATLQTHAEEIAEQLRRPVDARDVAAVNITLMKMTGLRPHLRQALRVYERAVAQKAPDFTPKTDRAHRRIEAYFKAVRFRLRQWRLYQSVVEQQVMAPTCPLYPEPPAQDLYVQRLQAALHQSQMALHRLANPNAQSQVAEDSGMFPDIPLRAEEFIAHVHGAHRLCLAQGLRRPFRFLDVGCGGGTKVELASSYFDRADGIEYDPAYAAAARRFLQTVGAEQCSVTQADGILFEGYDAYDVIYFYRPLSDTARLQLLEDQIVRMARPGTILIAPYDMFRDRAAEIGATHIEGRLFVTGLSEVEADALRRHAEQIGTHTVVNRAAITQRVGFWRPVIEASQANGWKMAFEQLRVFEED